MSKKSAAEHYLAKAAEAEAFASKFPEGFLEDSWLGIANGYRDLAESHQGSTRPSSEEASRR